MSKKPTKQELIDHVESLVAKCEELTRERDEARWEVCGFHHLTGFLAGDYAISRGWDYFNDERKWQKFPPSVTDFKEFLKAHSEEDLKTIERLREERDEAVALKNAALVTVGNMVDERLQLVAERDEARKMCCELEARIIVLEEDRRDTSNKFGTNPCSEIILADYPLARYPKEIAKRKGWDCFKEKTDYLQDLG